uniref:Uncharacterized protein n=1 Tax=Schistocephalus solidus TaxID=70667 RepID=A0A0X3P2G5_SCHSO
MAQSPISSALTGASQSRRADWGGPQSVHTNGVLQQRPLVKKRVNRRLGLKQELRGPYSDAILSWTNQCGALIVRACEKITSHNRITVLCARARVVRNQLEPRSVQTWNFQTVDSHKAICPQSRQDYFGGNSNLSCRISVSLHTVNSVKSIEADL